MSYDLTDVVSLFCNYSNNITFNLFSVLVSNYIPLKFVDRVKYFSNVKFFILSRFEMLKNSLLLNSAILQVKFFYRKFYFVRFLNHFLLGIFGTSLLSKLIVNKLNNFIKSNIRFFFDSTQFFKSTEADFSFLGFNLRFSHIINKKLINMNISKNSKYTSKILSRIQLRKLKISNLFKSRITSELFSHIVKVIHLKKLDFSFFKQRLLWIYIFQLESIRNIQSNNLLELEKRKILISDDVFSDFKDSSLNFYSYMSYSFDLYLRKLEIIFKGSILDFSSLLYGSISSFDISLNILIYELMKSLLFCKEKFYSDSFSLEYNFSSSFSKYNKYFRSNKFSGKINIFAPFKFLIKKFRVLGFIHPFKNNPIGNFKYFIFEDQFIIEEFNYLITCFLTWYRCSDNFSEVKLFSEYIRESCLLTLSRKHNKSKAWVYSVYTSDFILYRNISLKRKFFPSKLSIMKLQKKYLFSYFSHHFDELLFLMD